MLERLIAVFAPHVCIDCGCEENRLLCEGCTASLPRIPSRCYRCSSITDDYEVCRDCTASTPLSRVLPVTFYAHPADKLVHRLKYERARAGAAEIAAAMAILVPCLPEGVLLTHVPTASRRVRERGYDQAHLIARSLARQAGLPYASMLARAGQAHQVGSGRTARIRQLRGAFRPLRPASIYGKHVVLIDDVLTTGATLEEAARTLKRAGAKRVSAITFAQA